MQSKVGKVRKFPLKIFILAHPKQISVVSKVTSKKKKKKKKRKKEKKRKKVLWSFSYISPFHFKFSSSPFTIFTSFPSLFSLYCLSFSFPPLFPSPFPFFPLPSLFPHFPLPSKIYSQPFQGWATRPPRPPLVTPLFNNKLLTTTNAVLIWDDKQPKQFNIFYNLLDFTLTWNQFSLHLWNIGWH